MRWFIILWSLFLVNGQVTMSPTRQPITKFPTSPTLAPTLGPTLTPTPAPTVPTQSPTIKPYVESVTVYGGLRRDQVNLSVVPVSVGNSRPITLFLYPFNKLEPRCQGPQIASNCTIGLTTMPGANVTNKVYSLSEGAYELHADYVKIVITRQQPYANVGSWILYGRQHKLSNYVLYSPQAFFREPSPVTLPTYHLARIVKSTTLSLDTVGQAAQASVQSSASGCVSEPLVRTFENSDVWVTLTTSCNSYFNDTKFQSLLNISSSDVTEGPAILSLFVPRYFYVRPLDEGSVLIKAKNDTIRAQGYNFKDTNSDSDEVAYSDLVGPSFNESLYIWGLPNSNEGWKTQNTNSYRILPTLGTDISDIKFETSENLPRVTYCNVSLIPGIANTNRSCIVGFQSFISISCFSNPQSFCGATIQISNSTSKIFELATGAPGQLGSSLGTNLIDFFAYTSWPGVPLELTVTTASFTHLIKLRTIWIESITFWDQNNHSLPIDASGEFLLFNTSKRDYTFPLSSNFTVLVTCNFPPCSYSVLHTDEFLRSDNQFNLSSGNMTAPFKQSISPLRIFLDFAPQFVYTFTPYVRSFANIPFRVGQRNDTSQFIEYPPFFDTLVTTYSQAVLQYFTFSVDIFHCSGATPPCEYEYSFMNVTKTAYSGASSIVLKLPSPADSPTNFTTISLPLVIKSGDGTGTYTINLHLATVCEVGYYFPSRSGQAVRCPALTEQSEACCRCPEHASCDKALEPPRPEAGYVRGEQMWDMVKCDPPQACMEGGTCAVGYKNAQAACSLCESAPPHFRVNRFCEECPKYTMFVAVVGFVLFLCALALFVKISKPDHTKKFTLPIALGYAQIISIFVTFPVPWPPISLALFNIFSFLNFNVDLFSPECAVQVGFFSKWLFKIFLPIITVGIFAIVYITVLYVPRIRNWYVSFLLWDIEDVYDNFLRRSKFQKMTFETEEKRQQHENALRILKQSEDEWQQARVEWEETHLEDRFINALVTAAIVGYTFIAKTASEPLNCVGQAGGTKLYVRADPAAYCYEGEWFTYRALSVFFTLIYTAGIPVFFAYLLIQAKRHNYLHEQAFYYRYGHLVLPYRAQFWYWELVQLMRKLVTIQLIEFFYSLNGTSLAQVNSVLITLIVFLALQEFLKPYEFSWCNRVAFCWNIASVLVLCSALLFDLGLDSASSTFYGIALFIICGFTIAISLYAFWLENKRSRARKALFNGTTMLTREKEEKDLLITLFGTRLGSSLHRKTRDLLVDDRTLLYAKLTGWASSSTTGAAIADASASTLEMMSFTDLPLIENPLTPSSHSESEPRVPPPLPAKQFKARAPPPLTSAQTYEPKPSLEPRLPIDDPPRRPVRLSQYARDPHLADVKPPIPPPRPPRRQFPGMKRTGTEGFTEMKQL